MSHSGSDHGCDELLFPLDRLKMFWYIASSLALGIAGLLVYLYYQRKGQFDDLEDVKYQMFREEE